MIQTVVPSLSKGTKSVVETLSGGTLRYADGRVGLSLHGVLGSFQSDGDAEFILGSTEQGPCTLWQAIRTNATATIFTGDTDTQRSSWSSNYLFVGVHFDDADRMLLSEAWFGFQELEAWLARPAFDLAFEGDATIARHESPPDIVLPIPVHDAKLRINTAFGSGGNVFQSLTWEQRAAINLEVVEPRSLRWFLERLDDLRALLGLLVGGPVTPTRFTAATADPRTLFVVYYSLVGEPSERTLHPAEMMFPYPRLDEDRLASVAARWFELQENLHVVVALLFGTLYARGLPREFRFLALTQALETYHRRTRPGLYVKPDDYGPVRDALTTAIPAGTDSSLRQALTKRLEYGNEFALRRRLSDLLKSLGKHSDAITSGPPLEFVEDIVAERNYLTHYPPGEPEPMTPADCVYSSMRLRALLTLLLLGDVGIAGDEAAEGLRRARWHRYVN